MGRLRVISPTHSVLDRLAAAIAWNDQQSREQAVLVAANQKIAWDVVEKWFLEEGETAAEFKRFRDAVKKMRRSVNQE